MIGILFIAVVWALAKFMWHGAGLRREFDRQLSWSNFYETAQFGLLVWIAVKVLT